MENFQSTKDFNLTSAELTPVGASKPVLIKGLVSKINYVESIIMPFISATMVLVDSAGLLQTLPIQGMEKVKFSVNTNARDEDFEYNFRVWKVANRYSQQNKQVYTLCLVSEEALVNETIRVSQRLQGNPESIVNKLLQESLYLSSTKQIFSENSMFEVSYLPTRERPFDIIAKLVRKCVSPKAKYNTPPTAKKEKSSKKSSDESVGKIKGSGGFFFWETIRGYNFFAVDSLCADKDSPLFSDKFKVQKWGPYVEKAVNASDNGDNRYTIESAIFSSDLDLMNGLRKGQYGSKIVFFNHSTGQYEEYDYVLTDTYDSMAHLGGQQQLNTISATQRELSAKPTKLMSILLDHETWYNEPEPASPEPKDGAKDPTKFADWQKYYAAQGTARYRLLSLQQCEIVIPGNAEICAGDRIDIRLINKAPTDEVQKEEEDKESSGLYLVAEITHTYDKTISTNGAFTSTLKLTRDSYGIKGEQSSHDNK